MRKYRIQEIKRVAGFQIAGKYQSWASNLRVLTTYMPVFLQYYHDFKWEALGMDQHRKTGGAEEKEKNLKGVFPSEIPV